ncbi:MAG: TauD/TfdA family dioxygenase [Cyanobacteria bacterium P01_H01_bin.35]
MMENDSFVTVNNKRFHYIWLRDNCLSEKSRHPTSFGKLYDFSEGKEIPKPKSVELTDRELIIDWDENPPHRSIFPIEWLMTYAYDQNQNHHNDKHKEAESRYPKEVLWNRTLLESYLSEQENASVGVSPGWKDRLFRFGFSLIHDLTPQEHQDFLASIGPMLHTEAGAFYDIEYKPGANDLGDTCHTLTPHTDYPNRDYPHLLTCFYMVKNESIGGESILVDGFHVAKDFGEKYPHYFRLLAETPIQFRQFYQNWQYFYTRSTPILKLHNSGDLVAVSFAHSHASNWNIPFEQVEEFYQAYATFFKYLKNPDYQYCLRLEKGDCLLMNNNRILHGRKSFDLSSGNRLLRVGYLVWDHITGRDNFEQYKDLYLSK